MPNCPTPTRQHHTAVNISTETADLLRRIVASECKRTGYRITMIDVAALAIESLAKALKVK